MGIFPNRRTRTYTHFKVRCLMKSLESIAKVTSTSRALFKTAESASSNLVTKGPQVKCTKGNSSSSKSLITGKPRVRICSVRIALSRFFVGIKLIHRFRIVIVTSMCLGKGALSPEKRKNLITQIT